MYNQLCGCVSFLVVAGNSSQNENSFWFPMSSFYKKILLGVTLLWSASQCVYFIRSNTLLLCIFFFFVYFSCTTQTHKLKFKSEYYLRINMWNWVKLQTPAITLWFPEQCLLGFFILEKQLASQDVFLIRSELSITTYLFLVLYRSTSLQSLLFLKNIETFLCK